MILKFKQFLKSKLNEDVFSTTYSPDEYDYAYDPGDTTDANRDQLPVGTGDGEEEDESDYPEESEKELKKIEISLSDIKKTVDLISDRISNLENKLLK